MDGGIDIHEICKIPTVGVTPIVGVVDFHEVWRYSFSWSLRYP
jgi:hypothetical protein